MFHHITIWPFKKMYEWLRAYYQNKQLKDQTAILQKHLLLDTTPEIDVSFRLIPNPYPPRHNIPIVDIAVKNYGGSANIIQGTFWITLSHDPTYKEEKQIVNTKMPKGKEEKFHLVIHSRDFHQVIEGHSVLKFHYTLSFQGPDKQPEEQENSYTYDAQKKVFISD
jgi:hypothetical protein